MCWVALIAACDGGGELSDAGVIDAWSGPDALQCSVAPAPEPREPVYQGFELAWAQPLGRGGRNWVFAVPDGVVVFTTYEVTRIAADGTIVETRSVPDGLGIFDVVQGNGHFGASVEEAGQRLFCVSDALGVLDRSRCAVVDGLTATAFDGTSYLAYSFTDEASRRSYDADATLLDETALAVDGGVRAAVASASREDVFALASTEDCYGLAHRVTTGGATVVSPGLPDDALPTGVRVAGGPFGRSFVFGASCRIPGECEAAREHTALLTTYLGETLIADRVAVAIDPQGLAMARDGDHTITLHVRWNCWQDQEETRCAAETVLSRFDLDAELLGVPVVLNSELDASSPWLSIATIAEGDYVVVDGYEAPSVRRIRIPVP